MLSRFLDCRRLYDTFRPKAGYFIYHFNILQGKFNWKYINERPCFPKIWISAIKSLHDHWLSFFPSSNVLYIAHLVLPKNKQHFDWKISRKRRILWTIWLQKTRDSSCVNFNTTHGTKKRQMSTMLASSTFVSNWHPFWDFLSSHCFSTHHHHHYIWLLRFWRKN